MNLFEEEPLLNVNGSDSAWHVMHLDLVPKHGLGLADNIALVFSGKADPRNTGSPSHAAVIDNIRLREGQCRDVGRCISFVIS